MDKKKLRYDLILLAVCLLLSLVVYGIICVSKKEGEYAVVMIDGVEDGRYPLSQEAEIVIESENGKNVLTIKNGYADMIDASCPDGLCEKQRRISKTGESIVCLPNRVTVTIVGGKSEVDLVG